MSDDALFASLRGCSPTELLERAAARLDRGYAHEAVVVAYAALRGAGDPLLRLRLHVVLSRATGVLGHRGQQRIHAREAERLGRGLSIATDVEVELLRALAGAARGVHDHALVAHYLGRALALARTTGGELVFEVLLELGMLALERDDLEAAREYIERAGTALDACEPSMERVDRLLELQAELGMRVTDRTPPEHDAMRAPILEVMAGNVATVLGRVGATDPADRRRSVRLLVLHTQLLLRLRRHAEVLALAEVLRERAEQLQESHVDVPFTIALVYFHLGLVSSLPAMAAIVANLEDRRIDELTKVTTEAVSIAAVVTMRQRSQKCMSLLAGLARDRADVASGMLELALRTKGSLRDAERRFWRSVHARTDADIAAARETLLARRGELATKLRRGELRGLAELLDELDRRPSVLAVEVWNRGFFEDPANEAVRGQLLGFANQLLGDARPWDAAEEHLEPSVDEPPDAAAVAAALPPRSALVELVKVRHYDPLRDRWLSDADYWALVVTPGAPVRRVALGLASVLEPLVAAQLEALRRADPLDAGPQVRVMEALHEVLWRPLEPHLGDVEAVAVAPDGALAAVPFGALCGPGEPFVIERLVVTIVGSGRDLLERSARPRGDDRRAVVIACPDYHASQDRTFVPLPETLAEARAIRDVLRDGVEEWIDATPTKTSVLQLASPAILHFATHGTFEPIAEHAIGGDDAFVGQTTYVQYARSLLAAGLALVGANASAEDGILSAFEVIGMNLRSTELVVLSACETGRGALAGGEGLLGLSRSFQVAGARAVVVSLWKLSDKEAARQMRLFYTLRAAPDRPSTALALARAQRERVAWLRTHVGAAPPAFWGALTVHGALEV